MNLTRIWHRFDAIFVSPLLDSWVLNSWLIETWKRGNRNKLKRFIGRQTYLVWSWKKPKNRFKIYSNIRSQSPTHIFEPWGGWHSKFCFSKGFNSVIKSATIINPSRFSVLRILNFNGCNIVCKYGAYIRPGDDKRTE